MMSPLLVATPPGCNGGDARPLTAAELAVRAVDAGLLGPGSPAVARVLSAVAAGRPPVLVARVLFDILRWPDRESRIKAVRLAAGWLSSEAARRRGPTRACSDKAAMASPWEPNPSQIEHAQWLVHEMLARADAVAKLERQRAYERARKAPVVVQRKPGP